MTHIFGSCGNLEVSDPVSLQYYIIICWLTDNSYARAMNLAVLSLDEAPSSLGFHTNPLHLCQQVLLFGCTQLGKGPSKHSVEFRVARGCVSALSAASTRCVHDLRTAAFFRHAKVMNGKQNSSVLPVHISTVVLYIISGLLGYLLGSAVNSARREQRLCS